MATHEEVQKLVMQVEGERELKKLVSQQDQAERLMKKLIDRFEEGKISQQDYAKRMEIVASHTLRLREKTEEVEKSLGKAGGAFGKYGQEIRQLGYVTQDFAQGGLGGILNNIDGLLYKFPAFAGAATIVGTAIWALGPPIKQMIEGLIAGSNKIPETTDLLEKLEGQVKKNADRLKELKDKQEVTNAEYAEYNKILAAQNDLEKQANDEREKRAAWEAQLRKEREEREPERPESAAVVGKTLSEMGGAEKVTEELTRKMGDVELPAVAAEQAERLEDLRAKQKAAPSFEEWNYLAGEIAKVENMLGDAQRDIAERAKGIVQGALTGDETQIRNLAGAFPRGGFDKATPEAITNAKIEAKRDADAKEAERQEAIGQRERQAQEQRALIAKQQGEEQWQKRKDAEDAKARADSATMAQRGRQAEMADQDEANRAQAAAWGPAPQETDAMEMAMVQAKAASISAVAQADAMLGVNSEAVQLFKQLEARFNHLQMRNSQQMGGQMGGGGFSQLPMYTGGL